MKMIMKLSIPFLFALILGTMSLKIKNNAVQDISDSLENIEAERKTEASLAVEAESVQPISSTNSTAIVPKSVDSNSPITGTITGTITGNKNSIVLPNPIQGEIVNKIPPNPFPPIKSVAADAVQTTDAVPVKKDNTQVEAVKATNLDFLNTLSKSVPNIDPNAADNNSFNLNILIGNTDSHITNQNLRNNGSFNKK